MPIEFNKNQENKSYTFRSRQILSDPVEPTAVRWLVNKGIVKDERSGSYILMAMIVIFLILSALITYAALTGRTHGHPGVVNVNETIITPNAGSGI